MNEISAFFSRYSRKSSCVRWWNILGEAGQNIEQLISNKWPTWKNSARKRPNLQIWEIVLAAVLMWFSCRSPEFTPLGGCECAVCSAAIIGLVSTRRYSSVLPLQDCLVICYLRFDPDTSCKLSYVLLLTNCLVIGVQEDADDISHRPLFPVSFPESAKDLFLAADERRFEKVQNFLQIQSTLTHRRPKRCRRHQGWRLARHRSRPNPRRRSPETRSPPRSTWPGSGLF